MRTDVVRTYKDIHSWVGIVSGIALFIAFYAGAITMFEEPLRRWASPPTSLPGPPALEATPQLLTAVLAKFPEAAAQYTVHVQTSPDQPARVSWPLGAPREHAATVRMGASLDEHGELVAEQLHPAQVAEVIDVLHQQVGLPFEHEVSMPIMGLIALLYTVALVSGIIALLPSLAKDVFALRLGHNLKRMWLDVHNALGLFSLPFHLVMALTAVVFAFHDQFYAAQEELIYQGQLDQQWAQGRANLPDQASDSPPLAPAALLERVTAQLPGLQVHEFAYRHLPNGAQVVNVVGSDTRHPMRAPTFGFATADPQSGTVLQTDYLPGHQQGWARLVSNFFALHFGSFGGLPMRWAYYVLGLAGAFVFYSGNLLWIEARRKRAARHGKLLPQTRASHVMATLSVGLCLGSISGISATLAAAHWLSAGMNGLYGWHQSVFYGVLLACCVWAWRRGAARGAVDLLWVAAATTLLIPLSSVLRAAPARWQPDMLPVDLTALLGALLYARIAWYTRQRVRNGGRDSVWSDHKPDGATVTVNR